VVDSPTAVSFTIPGQIPIIMGNAGNQQATLVFRNGSSPAVTCTYKGGASASHPTTPVETIKGLKYQFQSCSDGSQAGATALATHFELSLIGVDCQSPATVTKARVHLGGDQCSDAVVEFISPDDTYSMRTQFSWTATQPVAETNAAGNPTLWYAMIYIHDSRQPDALDSLLIHHQKPPIFVTPGQTFPKLCGKLESAGDGEGHFEYALLTGAAYNKLRSLALAAGADLGTRGLFKVIKILTAPVAGAANADGSVSTDFLKAGGFRYMGYLAGQTVTHPDGTTDVIARPDWWDPLDWPGDVWDAGKSAGEWVLVKLGNLVNTFLPAVTVSLRLRAFSKDPVFSGQPLIRGWGQYAGTPPAEIGISGVRVNLWYITATIMSVFGDTTDANGQITVQAPEDMPFVFAEVPLENDAANITWNGITTHTMVAWPPHLNVMDGDTTSEIDDSTYLNPLAQFSDGRDFLMKEAAYTPHKVKVAEGYVINSIAWAIGGHAVTPCATFPNLVFAGINFTSFLSDVALLTFFSPGALAALVALPWETAVNSDMWLPDYDDNIFQSRGVWTHEYGHYALCSMMNDSSNTAFVQLTAATLQQAFTGSDIGTGDEARILNEAFADFFAAQVAGGTNYYQQPEYPPNSQLSDNISYCYGYPCLEKNRFETDTGREVIARDITLFMDAFDGNETPNWTDAGDSWTKTSSSPVTLGYASQKYADSCLAGNAVVPVGSSYTCDEPVMMAGPQIHDWINEWAYSSLTLNHTSIMKTLASVAQSKTNAKWCDVCRLFAAHTSAHAALPQDLGLTAQVPITQFADVCLSSPIKDWIGAPPDPDLTRILNSGPYQCEVCIPGSTPGPNGCICGAHQIPFGFDSPNCYQCAANDIAVLIGPNWNCVSCDLGVPVAGQNLCQCNLGAVQQADGTCQCGPSSTPAGDGTCQCIPGATRAPDGTCVGGCSPTQIWQGGVCVDCTDASWPNPTQTACLTCPASTPYCIPFTGDLSCHGDCVSDCGPFNAPPAPGSDLCGQRCTGPGPCQF